MVGHDAQALPFSVIAFSAPVGADPTDISAQRLLTSWKEDDPGMKMLAEVIASAFASGFSWGGDASGRHTYCAPPNLTGPDHVRFRSVFGRPSADEDSPMEPRWRRPSVGPFMRRAMTGSAPESPPQRRAASDRRLLHYDESRSLQVWDQALRDVSDMSSSALWTRLGNYSRQSEAALATFMEKVSARGAELEAAAAARFDQFRCLPANATPPDVV